MTDIVQALYQRIQKMTPSRLEDAYLMDMAGLEIKGLRKLLDRIVDRKPDGTVAIRLTEDALNAAAEYLPPNA